MKRHCVILFFFLNPGYLWISMLFLIQAILGLVWFSVAVVIGVSTSGYPVK